MSIRIHRTDAARHMPVFRQCVVEMIGNHRILIFVIITAGCQTIIDRLERRFSIVIIRVDHRKRSVDHLAAAENRMTGSPRFDASLRNLKSIRKTVIFLIHILHLHVLFHAVSDMFLKLFLNRFLDNKYDLFESSLDCVEDRKIDDQISFPIDRINLLQTAVPAAHTSRHDHQNWLLTHENCPRFLFLIHNPARFHSKQNCLFPFILN